jgi:lysostaphin
LRNYRHASHLVVVLIAMAISGYGAVDLSTSLAFRAGLVNASAAQQGGQYGGLFLDRDSTIIKPVSIPTAPLPDHRALRYVVQAGDSLAGIASAYRIPLRQITWSNPGLRLPLKVGQMLKLPPVPGVVVVIKRGDSPASLAASFGVDETTILWFNHVRASDLIPGLTIVIPVDMPARPNLSTGMPADPMDPGALFCPIQGAKIIQQFGPTSFALEPAAAGYLHFHSGVDLLAEYGTPILAAAGGKVTAAGVADYFGLRVAITDSYGLVEIYAHMSDIAVKAGDSVQQGQKVGLVGSTGLSVGSHLHLQLEIGGEPTDPTPLVGC